MSVLPPTRWSITTSVSRSRSPHARKGNVCVSGLVNWGCRPRRYRSPPVRVAVKRCLMGLVGRVGVVRYRRYATNGTKWVVPVVGTVARRSKRPGIAHVKPLVGVGSHHVWGANRRCGRTGNVRHNVRPQRPGWSHHSERTTVVVVGGKATQRHAQIPAVSITTNTSPPVGRQVGECNATFVHNRPFIRPNRL